jgi:hypothetical protein
MLIANELTPGGSSRVHIYTKTVEYSTVHIYTQTVQYNTAQYSTIQYSTVHIYTQTVQYNTVQYSRVQYSTIQYSTHLHTKSTVQYSTHLHKNSTVQYSRVQYSTIQYSTHLHTNSTQNDTINFVRVQAVPCLCQSYPDICLTTEEKARKNLSQGSRRVPVGTMRTEYIERNIHNNKNT